MTSRDEGHNIPSSEATDWFLRLHCGVLSPEEQECYEQWLEQDPQNRIAIAELGVIWEASGSIAADYIDSDPELYAVGSPARSRRLLRPSRRTLLAAFAATVVLALGLLFHTLRDSPQIYATDVGEQQIVSLPDGSRVHLNTDSLIEVHFDEALRFIRLSRGEAIFDVAHDADRAFEVEAGAGRVRAVGTVFNVRAVESEVVVTVLEGSVSVQSSRREVSEVTREFPAPVLEAREEVRYGEAGLISEVQATSLRRIEGWRAGKVDLEDVSLSEAASEMNRYANTKLLIGDDRLNAYRISGVFRIGDVEGMVAGLTSAFPIRAVYGEDSVVLLADSNAGN